MVFMIDSTFFLIYGVYQHGKLRILMDFGNLENLWNFAARVTTQITDDLDSFTNSGWKLHPEFVRIFDISSVI